MPAEPAVKRTIAFVDGQNLFHNCRNGFGYTYPNFDVQKLAQAVCAAQGWTLERVQFYTGVPSSADNAFWHGFWANKLAMMGRRGVVVYSRPLVYRNKTIQVPGFGSHILSSGEEKGIDVRLALHALDAAHRNLNHAWFEPTCGFYESTPSSPVANRIRSLIERIDCGAAR